MKKLWDVKAAVIPTVVSALGRASEELENHVKSIGIPIVVSFLQRTPLLETAFILRSVLGISEKG